MAHALHALTQAEWYAKLSRMVPSWVLQQTTAQAYFSALAKVFADAQDMVDEHVTDTFILESRRGVLDTHGDERSLDRLDEELDSDYRYRVQSLINQSNIPALIAFINKILVAGTARIQEDYDSVPFLDREYFCNRAALFLEEPIHNTFTVVVDKQLHTPYSFADREYFADREDFVGTSESLDRVFALILKIVNDNKALGTFYRIIELLE